MKYLLGIDFGGGASKATLLAADGTIAAESTVEYPTHYPRPGWAEQDPDDWYRACCRNIRAVLASSGILPANIEAVTLDAATHTAVLADEDFRPLQPAIYWTDTRSVAQKNRLAADRRVAALTLHQPDTIWTLPQLMWVRENRPEIYAKTRRILFAKDYVRHQLTDDHVTDYIEAQGSMFFDYGRMTWSKELCALAEIPETALPKLCAPTDLAGTVTQRAAEDTGLYVGTPVFCGATDTAMEVFTAGAVHKGDMTVKLATAGRICVISDKACPHPQLINYSHILPGLWYPGTATKSCAASYRWFRDGFGGDYAALDAAAAEVSPGAEGLLFHPYLNGELTPYGDPSLCGSFVGVRACHTKAHFARAVLEGVALSLRDCMRVLKEVGLSHGDAAVMIGGGGKSPLWRQITADVLEISLVLRQYSDSSLGSAMLAGVASGVFESPEAAVERCNRTVSETLPDPSRGKIYRAQFEKYRRVHDALAPIYAAAQEDEAFAD